MEIGLWLKQYVDPILLSEFKNYKDDFIATIPKAPKAAVDTDGLRFNKLINGVGFHINKTTPFTPITTGAERTLIEWDKLDTDLTEVTDAELRALPFDKDSEIKKHHTDSFKIGLRNYIMHKLAPSGNVANAMPVLATTGEVVGNRRRVTILDVVNFITELKKLNLPDTDKWYMVLCAEHEADLLVDRNKPTTVNKGDLIINPTTGKIERLYELKFFTNNYNVTYTSALVKKAQGAAAVATDRNASIFYYAPNTVYHLEKVTSLFNPLERDTKSPNPKSDYRLHAYGLCDKKQEYGFGALVSAVAS